MKPRRRLDDLFKKIEIFPIDDLYIQAQWSRYLCVLTSGFLEVSIRAIYSEYAKDKCNAAPNIAKFVSTKLEDFYNPSMKKSLALTASFNQTWEENLRTATEGELKDAIDSIVNNRHLIAHGQDVGISYVNIKKILRKCS